MFAGLCPSTVASEEQATLVFLLRTPVQGRAAAQDPGGPCLGLALLSCGDLGGGGWGCGLLPSRGRSGKRLESPRPEITPIQSLQSHSLLLMSTRRGIFVLHPSSSPRDQILPQRGSCENWNKGAWLLCSSWGTLTMPGTC